MAAKNGNADIAREYRATYGSKMPTAKLARIMYEGNKLQFKDENAARDSLRFIEGKKGLSMITKAVSDSEFYKTEQRPYNPYNLPESDETIWEPYILNSKRTLILCDIHVPYHSITALTAAIKWGKDRDPDTILLNGDAIDAHGLSRYVRDPKKKDFAAELAIFAELFQVLRKEFPRAKIIFKEGNHENRYDQFLYQKAGELSGLKEFSLEAIIHARAEGIDVVKEKRIIKAGALDILHGHEFASAQFSPVNVARGLFLRAKTCALQGHNHQTSEHSEPTLKGDLITTFSVGCLSELHPAFMPINKWNHGVADVEIDGDAFNVSNKRIYKGKIL